MIGKDFLPIDFTMFGLNLTDPMDFIYDIILGIISLYFASQVTKHPVKSDFLVAWKRFFLYFGFATILGAFGHLFYNYFHYYGKLLGWFIIPIAIYWIEISMITVRSNKRVVNTAKRVYLIKLIVVYVTLFIVWLLNPIYEKPQLLFLPIAINTILGLFIGVGLSSYQYQKTIAPSFKYILLGIGIIFPSAFIFLLKINLHQWFTKNDFSHILMIFGVSLFYIGVTKILKEEHKFLKIN